MRAAGQTRGRGRRGRRVQPRLGTRGPRRRLRRMCAGAPGRRTCAPASARAGASAATRELDHQASLPAWPRSHASASIVRPPGGLTSRSSSAPPSHPYRSRPSRASRRPGLDAVFGGARDQHAHPLVAGEIHPCADMRREGPYAPLELGGVRSGSRWRSSAVILSATVTPSAGWSSNGGWVSRAWMRSSPPRYGRVAARACRRCHSA